MSKFPTLRVPSVAGLTVLAILAASPMAAEAAQTTAAGTLDAGDLTVTAPVITPFSVTLTGLAQTVNTPVGAWNATDATGSDDGYSITVAASTPTVDPDGPGGAAPAPITGATMKLHTTEATPVGGNANTPPVAQDPQQLDISGTPTASTIQNAPAGTGQGPWRFPADTAPDSGLELVIPGTAHHGDYASTLTFTTAAPVAE